MIMSVIIPTYKRPEYLNNCLCGLEAQTRPADELIITVRTDDVATFELLKQWESRLPLRQILLTLPGQITAMNTGSSVAAGEVISVTDDDAVPRPDWLEKIEAAFLADDRLGALGGMDILRSGGDIPKAYTTEVGIIKLYGRILGNHHAGKGPAREVDHLKGVNLSWRAAAGEIPFSSNLRGEGAQVFNELSFCFRLHRQGWKIVYDPSILVDHYVAARFDEDNRAQRTTKSLENAAFNLYYALFWELQPGLKRSAAIVWARLIGFRDMPGILREAISILRKDARGKALAVAARSAWRDARAFTSSSNS